MDYCIRDDLYLNIAGLTSDNTKAGPEFLEDVIGRKSAHINAMIGDRYTVPVLEDSSPISFKILKDVCIELARLSIAKKLDIATPDSYPDQHPVIERSDEPEAVLRKIRKGSYTLPDAAPCGAGNCGLFQSGDYCVTNLKGIPHSERFHRDRENRRGYY